MAKKPGTNPKGEFAFFNVVYEDDSQRSNRRVPSELLGGLDGDEPARSFILKHLIPEIEHVAEGAHGGNYKSLLQQVAQREFNATPQYHLLDEKGPDHSKCFKIAAVIGRHRYHAAWGRNKKEAEQKAAMNGLAEINGEPIPFETD